VGADARMTATPRAGGLGQLFSDRVVVLFGTQVVTAGVGIFNGFVLAGLLGPSAKGDYYLLTLLPTTIMVLTQLGLPQAFGFYSARGRTNGLTRMALLLTAAIALPALAVAIAALPVLRGTFMAGLEPGQIILALLALPILLSATFTTGIVLGRQAVRWYAAVNISQVVAYSVLLVAFVAALHLGLAGALGVFLAIACIQSGGFLVGAARRTAHSEDSEPVAVRDLFRYGITLYPGTMTQYFSNRADVFMLAFLLADPSAPLGYYSMGVSMAEMVFFFPNAVSILLFPHVAGAPREDSNRQVPMVARVTLLMTAAFGLALVPVATILISVFLPAFTPALPALYVLLPGVVALSVSKVLSGYQAGLGRTGLQSIVSVGAFFLNVAVNLVLIPRYGIVGAAAASLVSYTASSIAYTFIAARLAGARLVDFWIPTLTDIRYTTRTILGLGRRLLRKVPGQA
jgi:O-antigen/teichoic acid export membrane protein